MCLQEVFFADIQQQIYRDLKSQYPYILSSVDLEADSSSTDGTACTSDEIQQAVQCLSNECSGLQGIQLAFCGGLRYTIIRI